MKVLIPYILNPAPILAWLLIKRELEIYKVYGDFSRIERVLSFKANLSSSPTSSYRDR